MFRWPQQVCVWAAGPRVSKHTTCQLQDAPPFSCVERRAPWPLAALLLTCLPGWGLMLPTRGPGTRFEIDVTE